MAGHAATAEKLARQHVIQAAGFMITRLSQPSKPASGRKRAARLEAARLSPAPTPLPRS
jgi:hypothetical protein